MQTSKHRQTERLEHRHSERQKETDKHRLKNSHADRQTERNRHTDIHRDFKTYIQTRKKIKRRKQKRLNVSNNASMKPGHSGLLSAHD